MKIKLSTVFTALALFIPFTQDVCASVAFTVTPAAVSNTYSGSITLQVTGLTNTETVVVQKFLDANTNGIIDGEDWLVQQFNLTDGTNCVIGGVTNFNVPGDIDTTAGQITARLNFQNGDFIQNIVGHYAFIISSSSGHFTPVTNFFTVTNSAYGQTITGNVVSNSTGTTVSSAMVLLFSAPSSGGQGPGTPLAGTVADNSGRYTFQMPPGTYVAMALKSNYVFNLNTSPVLALTSGQTISTNLTLTVATASITGRCVDAANTNIGLPGVFSVAKADGLFAITMTDSNGNFTQRVTSGQWKVGNDDVGMIIHGYVGRNNKTNVNSDTSDITIAYPKANALFYGSVKDNLGNPMVGIGVEAWDNNGVYYIEGYTDENGNYVVGVLGGLGAGNPWYVDAGGGPSNYVYSKPQFDQNGGTNLAAGQSLQVNFMALPSNNSITGNVQLGGTNLAGVGVWAQMTRNDVTFSQYTDTDGNGNYSMPVGDGTWSVGLNCIGINQWDSLDTIFGVGACQYPKTQEVLIANNNGTANFTVVMKTARFYGRVTDELGAPMKGILVQAWDNDGIYYSEGYTDANGAYSFDIVGGLGANDLWDIQVAGAGSSNPTNDIFSRPQFHLNGGTNINEGQSVLVNLTALPATHYVTGNVQHGGANIAKVGVWAIATINGTIFTQYADTDSNGNYFMPVGNGSWSVGLNRIGKGSDSLDSILGSGNYQYPKDQYVTINNNNGTANFTVVTLFKMTTTSLANGTVGVYYSQTLRAFGGQLPYRWWLPDGTITLPPCASGNMNLSTNGTNTTISGIPTTAGTYFFRVAVSDYATPPNVVTQLLSITINAKPSIESPSWQENQFRMRFIGEIGQNYTVQMSTNLSSSNWTTLLVTNSTTTNTFNATDLNATDKQRFYRVKLN